jgi:hypothetical protein
MKPPLEIVLLCAAFGGATLARIIAHRANLNGDRIKPNNATIAGFFLGPVLLVVAVPAMILMLVFLAILCLFAASENSNK